MPEKTEPKYMFLFHKAMKRALPPTEVKFDPEYVKLWIEACLAQGGTLWTWAIDKDKLWVRCYSGIGPELTQVWSNVPEDLVLRVRYGAEDLRVILECVAPEMIEKMAKEFAEKYEKLIDYARKKKLFVVI